MITVHNISPMDDFVFMQMKDGEEILCEASAKICGGESELLDIRDYGSGLSYDMGKAILNALDLKGVKTVVCTNEKLQKTLMQLRFSAFSCEYSLSLAGYFSPNC